MKKRKMIKVKLYDPYMLAEEVWVYADEYVDPLEQMKDELVKETGLPESLKGKVRIKRKKKKYETKYVWE